MMKLLIAFRNITKCLDINTVTLLKWAPNFAFPKQQRNEMTVGEEYCWAITQALGK